MSPPKQQPTAGRLFWLIGLTVGLISGAVVALALAGLVTPASTSNAPIAGPIAGVTVNSGL